MASSVDGMSWDLSQLVREDDPGGILREFDSMLARGESLRAEYYGRISFLNPREVLKLLELRDAFELEFEGVGLYCRLLYSADATDPVSKQLYDAVRTSSMKTRRATAFLDIELGELVSSNPALVRDPVLSEYRHLLEKLLRRVPHMLSETEERLVIAKDKNGVSAWQMLQEDWLSTRVFNIDVDGRTKTLPYGEIIGLYQSRDRDLRKRANQVVYENLGNDEILWASAIRAVCSDHVEMCDARKYPTERTRSLIDNDVDEEIVDSLMRTITGNVSLYQRYLGVKAGLMGVGRLANYDLTAPLPNSVLTDYSWNDAQREVVDAYSAFDREIGQWVVEMFEKRHIDARVRNGKRSGAFCSSWLAGKSAYVLQSFNGKIGDVYTLAHELGHAVHAYLGSRAQKPSNYQIGSCMAECGSTFGELLLTEHLLAKSKTKEERQTILSTVLDEFGMAAFQVSARVFFEQSLYDAIREGRFLDGETVSKLWIVARDRIFSDAVEWLDVMKWEWTMKIHYYIANYRFYNYPYVFAQLFVFALYKLFREEGLGFVPKLKRLLAAGSSESPRDLGADLGFDVSEEGFWKKGIGQANEFVKMLEDTLG